MNFRDRLLKAIPIIATWSFNFLIAVLKISVEILVSVFMVLGTLIAMSSSECNKNVKMDTQLK